MQDSIGYVRATVRCTEKHQVRKLKEAGVVNIVIEGQPGMTLDGAVKMLRKGRLLVVTSMDRIGAKAADLREPLERICGKGAVVFETTTGRRCDDPAQAMQMLLDAVKRKGHKSRDARKFAKLSTGNAMPVKTKERARKLWANHKLTGDQVAAKAGVSVETLYRWFGKRGTKPGKRTK